ncbi:MAG: hypothetical protein ACXWQR_21130 [Ktedonobacterales bacterium]
MMMQQPEQHETQPSAASTTVASYAKAIQAAAGTPQQLEEIYQSARQAHADAQFATDMVAAYGASPENVLYAAWYYRLQQALPATRRATANWLLAVPLSVLLGLVLWLLSDLNWNMLQHVPYIFFLWSPIIALFLIAFLSLAARRFTLTVVFSGVAVVVVAGYIYMMVTATLSQNAATQQAYFDLMLVHLPLLAWGALGLAVLGWRSSASDRFAFVGKSIETIGTAGVYSIAGFIFVGLTVAMFSVIGILIPDVLARLLVAGGAGLIPILAVASVYDPHLAPSQQEFRRGFGKILSILMQALLPLTLAVLVIYVVAIPFNFWQPFTQRDVLIVYNVVLFAIMGLLIGVTPTSSGDYSPRYQRFLRAGIIAVAGLMLLVSLYALSAILYRTAHDGLTMNRVTVVGWNVVNIGLLVSVLVGQIRAGGRGGWVAALHSTARIGTVVYIAWGLLVILLLPWIF